MKSFRTIISIFFLLFTLCLSAQETQLSRIELLSGGSIVGKILYQNDEMVVVRTPQGARYQYLMKEVKSIDEYVEEQTAVEQVKRRKVGVMVDLTGGGSVVRNNKNGGYFGFSVSVGANNLLDRHWFLGGGFGVYDQLIPRQHLTDDFLLKDTKKSMLFVPLFINTSLPLINQKHAPFVGAALGYGFSTKKGVKGGLYASVDFGYRVQLNDYNALSVGFSWTMQQSRFDNIETVDNNYFAVNRSHIIHSLGVKLSVVL